MLCSHIKEVYTKNNAHYALLFMTQVPEAYEQAKKHILFYNYCIPTKIDHT